MGFGHYPLKADFKGAIYFHAISVGESLLAIKLIETFKEKRPSQHFILAVGTVTAFLLVKGKKLENVQLVYASFDFKVMTNKILRIFSPTHIVLLESELWPHLLEGAYAFNIPIYLANARISETSYRRFLRFRKMVLPWIRGIKKVAIQNKEDFIRWQNLTQWTILS